MENYKFNFLTLERFKKISLPLRMNEAKLALLGNFPRFALEGFGISTNYSNINPLIEVFKKLLLLTPGISNGY